MCISGILWRRSLRLLHHAVRVCQLSAVAKGILCLHELLCREAVLQWRHAEVAATVAAARTLLTGGNVVESIIAELVGVILEFGLVVTLAAEMEQVEHNEDDDKGGNSAIDDKRISLTVDGRSKMAVGMEKHRAGQDSRRISASNVG